MRSIAFRRDAVTCPPSGSAEADEAGVYLEAPVLRPRIISPYHRLPPDSRKSSVHEERGSSHLPQPHTWPSECQAYAIDDRATVRSRTLSTRGARGMPSATARTVVPNCPATGTKRTRHCRIISQPTVGMRTHGFDADRLGIRYSSTRFCQYTNASAMTSPRT